MDSVAGHFLNLKVVMLAELLLYPDIDCATNQHNWVLQLSMTSNTGCSWKPGIHDLIHNCNFWMILSTRYARGVISRKQSCYAWMQMMMSPKKFKKSHFKVLSLELIHMNFKDPHWIWG